MTSTSPAICEVQRNAEVGTGNYVRPLPTFDILMPLAVARTWHRYREHVHKKLQEQKSSGYIMAVAHHVTRMQRTSEGLAAFATTGAQTEVSWLLRPLVEILASQCILQHSSVKFPGTDSYMTKPRKAQTYFMHAKFSQHHIQKKHFNWTGHSVPAIERKRKIEKLEKELKGFPNNFDIQKPWHLRSFSSATSEMIKVLNTQLKRGPERLGDIFPIWEEIMNCGIHGSSFTSDFLIVQSSEEESVVDNRTPCEPRYYEFASILCVYSMELLAKEFGQEPLINGMLETAKQELEQSPNRFQQHFPTALVNLTN